MDTVVKTGKPAPDFKLVDLEGRTHTLFDYRGKIVVINFWSAECSWTERADEGLLPMLSEWEDRVVLLSIGSNANETREEMSVVGAARGVDMILHDADQKVAKLYGAMTTPHVFVVDAEGKLRYQGAFDDVSFRQREPTINYLYRAVDALLADELPEVGEALSYGCTVVYHAVG